MKKIKLTALMGIIIVLGACTQTPRYYIHVLPDQDNHPCLMVNNIESNGGTYSKEDPSQRELDRSGVYCRVEKRIGNPRGTYPKQ